MSCPQCDHPRVRLLDGRQVCTYSQDWRHECEARAVLAMPDKLQRRQYLRGAYEGEKLIRRGILQIRGEKACAELEATIRQIWERRA